MKTSKIFGCDFEDATNRYHNLFGRWFEAELSISGYYRLVLSDGRYMYNEIIHDDPACDDVYDEESAKALFASIICEDYLIDRDEVTEFISNNAIDYVNSGGYGVVAEDNEVAKREWVEQLMKGCPLSVLSPEEVEDNCPEFAEAKDCKIIGLWYIGDDGRRETEGYTYIAYYK